ncbi:MAG: VOC family protein [Jatrophihabitans sp.]|uniref:VOC family protein n=1 Tax=Jatrophihabitans sp. TaxID=1932789 RepID=UPI00391000FA
MNVFADVPAPVVPAALDYWERATGAERGEPTGSRREFIPLVPPDGDRYFWVQRMQGGSAGWHLDLYVPSAAEATASAVEAGAGVVGEQPWFFAFTSPGGQPFCLVDEDRPGRCRPVPSTWRDGRRSLVDQLCIDIPADRFEAECDFWAELTGWPRERGSELPEFDRLTVPTRLPLRILLQRLGADDTNGIRAHVDMSCDDRDAEAARHQEFGATLQLRAEHWTTLRDPVGLTYCITDRGVS